MVTTFYPPYHFGGDAIYAYNLSNELAKLGHQVDVIHCYDAFRAISGEPDTEWPNHENVRIHTLRSPWKLLSPVLTHQTGRSGLKKKAIEEIFRKNDFDVIHYHNISLLGGVDILAAGEAIKLFTLHEYWLICPTHIMFKNNSRPCEKAECLRCQLIYRRPPQLWRSAGKIAAMVKPVDRFLVSNRFTVELHKQRGLDLNAEILPLFINLPEKTESLAEQSRDDEQDYFLFAGRLEKLKGLQDVLPFFVDSAEHSLLVAGTGSYEAKLRRLAGNSPNIHFLGLQSASSLRRLYQNARATIIPSLCYEVSPLVIAESWSCGTPVIARELGSLKEVVEDFGGGLCFSSIEELKVQLTRLAADNVLRDRLSKAASKAWSSHWTPGKHMERYLGIIDIIRTEAQPATTIGGA